MSENNENALKDFLRKIHEAQKLTYSDVEGLTDSEIDLEDYIDNVILNVYDDVSKRTNLTWEELESHYSKNWY